MVVARERKLLPPVAAACVSVAFGSQLGGVLSALEELDAFSNTAMCPSLAQCVRAFELIPWVFLSVIGGLLGSLLIKLNAAVAVYRRHSLLHEYPIEVIGFTAVTGAVSYLVMNRIISIFEAIFSLWPTCFQECDATKTDYHGLCNPTATWANVFLLILTAAVKIGFTSWTFGMMPTIAIGALLGRAVGLITQGLYRPYPDASTGPNRASLSSSSSSRCASLLVRDGFRRPDQLVAAHRRVLARPISVMVSKWAADPFGKDGMYSVWIAMRQYPWLPAREFRDQGQTAASVMKPAGDLVVVHDAGEDGEGCTVNELDELVSTHVYRGFPVVRG
ncbi:chloride channel [Daedaleopsis nitida]|nr:chloride channel [Daedaleopsis nitida]